VSDYLTFELSNIRIIDLLRVGDIELDALDLLSPVTCNRAKSASYQRTVKWFNLVQPRYTEQHVTIIMGSSDGWAKNQLGERRLGELFFGRQARTVRRQQIGRLGDIVQTVWRNV